MNKVFSDDTILKTREGYEDLIQIALKQFKEAFTKEYSSDERYMTLMDILAVIRVLNRSEVDEVMRLLVMDRVASTL